MKTKPCSFFCTPIIFSSKTYVIFRPLPNAEDHPFNGPVRTSVQHYASQNSRTAKHIFFFQPH
jgi:hypothetical protein